MSFSTHFLFSRLFQSLVFNLDQHWHFVHRDQANQSAEVTFTLLSFSECPQLQLPLFLVFLTIYTVTVLGNLGMILIIKSSFRLRTPMYFFLNHLSFVDFCYSTVVTPKLLENLIVADRIISLTGCIMQFFLACISVVTETFLLAVMAYDQSVAICNPLLYTVVMSQRFSFLLMIATYSCGIACSLIYTYFLSMLSFWRTKFINIFVCEHPAIVAVSCSDPYISQEIILASATVSEVSRLMIILTSYICIFITVLRMPSAGGRHKAFSTCAPTWLPSPSSMGPSFSSTVFLTPEAYGSWSRWPLSFTQSSSPCWTHWSTASGTKMWKSQWRN